jgi:hypothetical protein
MSERPLWRLIAGRKAGPYEPAKLRPLVKDGRIGPLDRFSYDGETWRPVTDFPELLRAPAQPAATAASVVLDDDPLADEPGGIDMLAPIGNETPMVVVGRAAQRDSESAEDAKLLKAIYLLMAFGGGLFVLLIGYIVIASAWKEDPPGPGRPQPAAASANPAAKAPAATEASSEPPVAAADSAPEPEPSVSEDQPAGPPAPDEDAAPGKDAAPTTDQPVTDPLPE